MAVEAGQAGVPVLRARRRQVVTSEDWLQRGLLLVLAALLLAGVILPLIPLVLKSFADNNGQWVGLDNYIRYFTSPGLSSSFAHSVSVSVISTVLAVSLAFGYALALTRTHMRGKGIFRAMAYLPLLAPSLALGIGLVYLFGNKGLVTTGFLGFFEARLGIPLRFDINLYGINGIILGELFFCFPQALLILTVAANLADARLYEASTALRATPLRTFMTVTLPSLRYGLISAAFVCFTLAFTDFGIPKVVGGNYNVLATDIYKQVIGQQNFAMGATISILLLLPTVLAFVVDRIVQQRHSAALTARSIPYRPKPSRRRDLFAFLYCLLVAGSIVVVMGTIVFASLVNVWPYKLGLTLRHYDFGQVGGGGWNAFANSLQMSFYSAVFGVAIAFVGAYLIEKTKTWPVLRTSAAFASILPLALPGMVIGLAYIFFFNPTSWQVGPLTVPNPLSFLYGTIAILVLANIIHFFTVSYVTAGTALKQLDHEFESISASLRVPFYRTFWFVTLPLCLPAVLEIGLYLFVNAMVTVSAVIFLYSPQFKLASVAIVNMDDAGDTASAAAMSSLIMFACLAVRLIYSLSLTQLSRRTQHWRIAG
ncbi:MAG: putative 2-aminoethylphosphonate ABC transporter permease subunit [Caldilineaceae bacterium]